MAPLGAVLAVGVNVRVGELGGVQGDEVPVGAQVGLEVAHRAAMAGDAEGQLGLLAGLEHGRALQLDVVAVDRGVQRRGRAAAVGEAAAGRDEGRAEHVLAAVDDEVGDRAVAPGRGASISTDQVPSAASVGWRCW